MWYEVSVCVLYVYMLCVCGQQIGPGWTWLGRRPRPDELFRLWLLTWAKLAPRCPSFLS